MKHEICDDGAVNLVQAIFEIACSDYTIAYYNTHFCEQYYEDKKALHVNEDFLKNSKLMRILYGDEERENILVMLRKKVIDEHKVFKYGKNSKWITMKGGKRATYAK